MKMKKMMKKFVSIIIALVIFVECMPVIEAKADSTDFNKNIRTEGAGGENIGSFTYGQNVNIYFRDSLSKITDMSASADFDYGYVDPEGDYAAISVKTDVIGSHSGSCTIKTDDLGDIVYSFSWTVEKRNNSCTISVANATFGVKGSELNVSTNKEYDTGYEMLGYMYSSSAGTKKTELSFLSKTLNPMSVGDAFSDSPIVPGDYTAFYYNGYDSVTNNCYSYSDFTIEKATPTITISNINTGETPEPIVTAPVAFGGALETGNIIENPSCMGQYKILYKAAGADDSAYSETVPTKAGDYVVKYEPKESPLYFWHNSATATFKINAKDGKGSVKVADTVYGESSVKPVAESETNGKDNVVFYFKKKDSEDSTYTKDVPKIPGKYTCKAVFPATGEYNEVIATCNFIIDKGKGVATMTAANGYVGTEPKLTPVSATNGITNVTYYYKTKGSADSTYTTVVPTKPGDYVVKGVFATTDYYYPVEAVSEFKITYMPAPTFDLSGTKGKNSFYTSDVSIDAPAGYLVSVSENGEFKSSVKLLNGNKYVYFKDAKTGALSDKVEIPSYKIDSAKPQSKGFKNGEKKYADEFEIGIDDENLDSVTVNGTKIDIKNGSCTYVLKAEKKATEFKIVATDLAGNTVSYVVTVIPEWMEDFIIPVGEEVTLEPNQEYNLSNGEWKVSGDDTVYAGGNSFYVKSEKDYKFESVSN